MGAGAATLPAISTGQAVRADAQWTRSSATSGPGDCRLSAAGSGFVRLFLLGPVLPPRPHPHVGSAWEGGHLPPVALRQEVAPGSVFTTLTTVIDKNTLFKPSPSLWERECASPVNPS